MSKDAFLWLILYSLSEMEFSGNIVTKFVSNDGSSFLLIVNLLSDTLIKVIVTHSDGTEWLNERVNRSSFSVFYEKEISPLLIQENGDCIYSPSDVCVFSFINGNCRMFKINKYE